MTLEPLALGRALQPVPASPFAIGKLRSVCAWLCQRLALMRRAVALTLWFACAARLRCAFLGTGRARSAFAIDPRTKRKLDRPHPDRTSEAPRSVQR